jgi:hypothetical protein
MNDIVRPADFTRPADQLVAYVIEGHHPSIRPAPVERDWMDATDKRYAYRCLPLNIANAHGWELLCPSGFTAMWNGRNDKDAVGIAADPGTKAPGVSHFGHGVLTFHVPIVFRTDPGVDLYVTGPVNRPKDAIGPLTGIVETDWAPYTFTMNWLFTRPNAAVRFERGEPICHFFPLERGRIERAVPSLRRLADAPDIARQQKAWSESRNAFNTALADPKSKASEDAWQKSYFRGLDSDGTPAGGESHRSRLRLKSFIAANELESPARK